VVAPDFSVVSTGLTGHSVPTLVAGVCVFSIVNATAEELMFRGAFLSALTSAGVRPSVALFVQAVYFGLFHYRGVPSGGSGVVLAFVFAVVLGYLKTYSRGLLAPCVAHALTDVSIGLLVLADCGVLQE
jgi:membrane protease YdiL (CAAX protease family)